MGDIVQQNKSYVLATGSAAVPRLRLLDEIFGPASRQLLLRVGLRRGDCIADIGCGTGLMSLWMAGQVGATGKVWAVDASREQLRIAEQDAKAAGLNNLLFHEASAYDTQLPRDSFDFVYSRFLMCHLTRPAQGLAEMRALLKPSGILVCEDYEMSAVGTHPPTAAYQHLIEVSGRVDARHGVDSTIGAKLHSLFLEAGFRRPEVAIHQPAFLRGEVKQFWELTLREAAPAIVACEAATTEELEELFSQLRAIADDDTTLVLVARVFQVWARRDPR